MFGWKAKGKRKLVGIEYFLSRPTKLQSLQNREKIKKKNFCTYEKNIRSLVRYSIFLFFFSFSAPLIPLFTLDLFSSSFIFWFFVSSLFPFYASIFFSFFLASFLFLFPFFFTRFCFLSLLLSLGFFFFFEL